MVSSGRDPDPRRFMVSSGRDRASSRLRASASRDRRELSGRSEGDRREDTFEPRRAEQNPLGLVLVDTLVGGAAHAARSVAR